MSSIDRVYIVFSVRVNGIGGRRGGGGKKYLRNVNRNNNGEWSELIKERESNFLFGSVRGNGYFF